MEFEKYSYFLNDNIELPDPWRPIVLQMCAKLDKVNRPWYVPRCILNAIANNEANNRPQWKALVNLLTRYQKPCYIVQIKSKFATLHVKGVFDSTSQTIITTAKSLCNNTCESCGDTTDVKHVGISGWVTNLCPKCVKKLKGNDSSNRNDSCIS